MPLGVLGGMKFDEVLHHALEPGDFAVKADEKVGIRQDRQQVVEQGLPQERIDAALHQYEFANREVTGDQYPYGLGLMMRLFGPWLHADDPLGTLMINDNLQRLRSAAADAQFFPELIRVRTELTDATR